ncbi:MAG TPA: dehydrogenase [Planctomycetaceae bacterium]|nr:dehydrogenase [Planctomycetaceae bacterium]
MRFVLGSRADRGSRRSSEPRSIESSSLRGRSIVRRILAALPFAIVGMAALSAQEQVPHNQSQPPNDPYSADEAAARMTVPEGFTVDVVASEPDLVNPVAMAIDERGRFWVCESIEYPRTEAGEGRDRIRILEDTDGDGRIDRTKVFADGLNIPSGIALGRGGVWVANAPDLLLLKDTDGDDVADSRETIVTGFGRTDTHELPNSLVWGPDGWLYGLNGVFNYSRVEQSGEVFDFTCAMFRVDPVTHRFELFAEGTSNPWGIAWNEAGEAFLSACVIDHLWHLSPGGYYHRQAGPYPPGTWKIESIVEHRHQMAAYCGIQWLDSPAFPEAYRGRLVMGNIHGNCLNLDAIERWGATYRGRGEPDLLQANDAWFMPVAQQLGPDGALYVLDWYDRYHCYQDARRDPEGIDRLKGRLYRLRHGELRWDSRFDLSQASLERLIDGLGDGNAFIRSTCRRLLIDRPDPDGRLNAALREVIDDRSDSRSVTAQREALWTSISRGDVSSRDRLVALDHPDPVIRMWALRDAIRSDDAEVLRAGLALASDDADPSVRLQGAVTAAGWLERGVIPAEEAFAAMVGALQAAPDDGLTGRLVYAHAARVLDGNDAAFATAARAAWTWPSEHPGREAIERCTDRLLDLPDVSPAAAAATVRGMLDAGADDATLRRATLRLIDRWATETEDEIRAAWREAVGELAIATGARPSLADLALAGRVVRGEAGAVDDLLAAVSETSRPSAERASGLKLAVAADPSRATEWGLAWIRAAAETDEAEFRATSLAQLARLDDPRLGPALIDALPSWPTEERGRIVEMLTGRAAWGAALIDAIEEKRLAAADLNANQVRKLNAVADEALRARISQVWGTLREGRDPAREQVIAQVRRTLTAGIGDPIRGQAVFDRVCAPCHRLYGRGAEVGPDLTGNGRGSFDQLLSNALDPSLVIGASYQATLVETEDGQVVTGLVMQETPDRLVLRTQGDVVVEQPRETILAQRRSELSLMPENLETSLQEQELRDLFALLTLDGPAGEAASSRIPGALEAHARGSDDPDTMRALLGWVLPDFGCREVGEGGMELLTEHAGRRGAIRVHPIDRETPCRIEGKIEVPRGERVVWRLPLSHDPRGDWRVVVRVDGEMVADESIGTATVRDGWLDLQLDLTRWAGQQVDLSIDCTASGWSWEFAYLGRATWKIDGAE